MKKIILFGIFILSLNCYSQELDTIFKMNGEISPVNIKEIDNKSIKFIYPGEDFTNVIEKNSVLKIKFKSGRTQEFASAFNMINVKSCLDWEKVQISNIESEVSGLLKIHNISAKAKGATTMTSLGKLENRTYNKLKIQTAMLGGSICYILNQNAEEGSSGYYSSKAPSVIISAISYTAKKVFMREINYGKYSIKKTYVLRDNKYDMYSGFFNPESFDITKEMIFVENNFPKLKLNTTNFRNRLNEFTIIYASQDEIVLSAIYTSRQGKKTFYNIFLEKN